VLPQKRWRGVANGKMVMIVITMLINALAFLDIVVVPLQVFVVQSRRAPSVLLSNRDPLPLYKMCIHFLMPLPINGKAKREKNAAKNQIIK
jgi:hypothetical protein